VTPLLEVESLCSGYGALQVLYDVSFYVDPGEVVALMGSNGAGKTTTLRAITRQLETMSGSVSLDGQVIAGGRAAASKFPWWRNYLPRARANTPTELLVSAGMALVPEGRGMLRDLSVEQNLELGAYTVKDKQQIADGVARAYEVFPILGERRTQKAGSLSGGQQQMLAIARALMSGPRLLLVDEASLGLSPVMTETAFEFIASANKTAGCAVLIVEQNVLALDLAQRAYVLEKGQVVDTASGKAVRAMQSRLRDAYLGKSHA
jgi:branched-chain amino acid transport system ATP-binding protein